MRILLLPVIALLCAAFPSQAQPAGAGSNRVKEYGVKVVKTYPHDTGAYTQGLFFKDGFLYESTGLLGKSSFRQTDPESGKILKKINFGSKYFMEGSVILGQELFLLTWQNRIAYVYDAATLKYKRAYSYPREGWGLTTDGKSLIASDGSDALYYMDREFRQTGIVRVRLNGKAVRGLNELEWIDGKIWANIYTTDLIVIINPADGRVESIVNCHGLLDEKLRGPETDVLNGIAAGDGRIFLTGKNWPLLFEIKLLER